MIVYTDFKWISQNIFLINLKLLTLLNNIWTNKDDKL